jgi:hypothetical protein
MTWEQMLYDLPCDCNVGTKKNSKGYKEIWVGYKLHIDAADGQITISCILTSESLLIYEQIRVLGHIPIIDVNPPRDAALKPELQAEAKRQKLLNCNYPRTCVIANVPPWSG